MHSTDVVIAGGGISGLLLASTLPREIGVVLLEQHNSIPEGKYWLTDSASLSKNPDLAHCVDCRYDYLDFIAYDGLTARIPGDYVLWNTPKLVRHLLDAARERGCDVLTGHRLYSNADGTDRIIVRANDKVIEAKLLVDCMGFGSPLVGAKGIADITGYYLVYGREVRTTAAMAPVGLDNVIVGRRPAFFEFFPTSTGTALAAIILPSRSHRAGSALKADWNFVITRSHYAQCLDWRPSEAPESYFGIIPVGHLKTPALDRIVFFGEAGQANPAASATGLTRMLHNRWAFANALESSLRHDRLDRQSLCRVVPDFMTPMNRLFQECLFERILSFSSDDFRQLVSELAECPPDTVIDLVFANCDFAGSGGRQVAKRLLRRPSSLLARTVLGAAARVLTRQRLR